MSEPGIGPPEDRSPLDVTIVEADSESLNYVLSNWGNALEEYETGRARSRQQLDARKRVGFLRRAAPMQGKLIRRSRVLLAMQGERIAGFCVYEPEEKLLHWISVRKEFQRRGIAKHLLAETGIAPEQMTVTYIPRQKGGNVLARVPGASALPLGSMLEPGLPMRYVDGRNDVMEVPLMARVVELQRLGLTGRYLPFWLVIA